MIILLWVLAGLVLLLAIRISVMAQYGQEGPLLRAWFGPFRMTLYPRPEKGPKKKKEKKEKKEKEVEEPEAVEKGGSVELFQAGLSMVGPILGQVKRRLVFRELTLHYTAASEDAAMTAFAYGGAHAAVSAIVPRLRYHFRVKKQDIQIFADFESQEDTIFVRVRLSISIFGLICISLVSLRGLLKSGILKMLWKRRKSTPQETKSPATQAAVNESSS